MARNKIQVKPFLLWMDPITKDLLEQIRVKTRRSMTASILCMIEEKAEEYGIRPTTAHAVITKKNWRHVI